MDDGNNGGHRYISIKVMKTNLIFSKASGSFTLMGLTAATGDPVLCIFIFVAQSLSVSDVKIFNYRASIPYDSSKTMEEKMGEGDALPGFPVDGVQPNMSPSISFSSMYQKLFILRRNSTNS